MIVAHMSEGPVPQSVTAVQEAWCSISICSACTYDVMQTTVYVLYTPPVVPLRRLAPAPDSVGYAACQIQ